MNLNCIVVDDDKITRELLSSYIISTGGLALLNACKDGIEAHNILISQKADIIFLDIEMPKMTGFDLLKTLDSKQNIIFITGSADYAYEAFEFDAIDYLLKPIAYSRFLKAINKLKAFARTEPIVQKNGHLFLKVNSEIVSLSREEILWIKSVGDYLQVVTKGKNYITLGTLKSMEEKLAGKEFIKVHRSYLVRRDKIEKIKDHSIQVNSQEIPLSKSLRKELLGSLEMF